MHHMIRKQLTVCVLVLIAAAAPAIGAQHRTAAPQRTLCSEAREPLLCSQPLPCLSVSAVRPRTLHPINNVCRPPTDNDTCTHLPSEGTPSASMTDFDNLTITSPARRLSHETTLTSTALVTDPLFEACALKLGESHYYQFFSATDRSPENATMALHFGSRRSPAYRVYYTCASAPQPSPSFRGVSGRAVASGLMERSGLRAPAVWEPGEEAPSASLGERSLASRVPAAVQLGSEKVLDSHKGTDSHPCKLEVYSPILGFECLRGCGHLRGLRVVLRGVFGGYRYYE